MDDATTTGGSSPMEQASGRPVACIRCRDRHSTCSKEQPACQRCRSKGVECIYPEGRKILILESYLRELERRVKQYESIPEIKRDQNIATPSSRTSDAKKREGEESRSSSLDAHAIWEGFTDLSVGPSGEQQTEYVGNTSSITAARRVSELASAVSPGGGYKVSNSNRSLYNRSALRLQRLRWKDPIEPPPPNVVKRLFAAQHSYIGTIFSLVDPETFELQLQAAYGGPPETDNQDACLAYSKVLVVLAFGQMYSVNQWDGHDGPPGFEYFTHALQYLPDVHEESSILFVETLSLIGYFLQNLDRRDAAFLYIGLALRMAISLGLHQEVPSSHLDEYTKERRRRVWWSVYSLDRILSVKSGNPITIQDKDIGVALPSRLPHEPQYCPTIVLRHYTQLSMILGRIGNGVYRKTPKSGSSLMSSVQEIMSSLSEWHRNIPDELRFDPAKLHITREQLLFHVVQQRLKENRTDDWKNGIDPSTVGVIRTCISAAQDTISMMTTAAEKDLVATYGYMDGEHIFSAALVLVMVCLSFPYDAESTAAMNAALALLERMADRGNTKMLDRYELLSDVRKQIETRAAVIDIALTSPVLVENAILADPLISTFPHVDNSALGDLFYDTNTMDFHLWEEGYTNQDMDFEQDLTDWIQSGGNTWNNNLS